MCGHKRGTHGADWSTNVLFPHRMPTSLRSMLFVLAPTAALWPLVGLIVLSIFGMSWEVGTLPGGQPSAFSADPILSLLLGGPRS
jgi:hypothetical protein